MASYNRVIIAGNLTRNIELNRTESGTACADLGVAVNENYKNKDGKLTRILHE